MSLVGGRSRCKNPLVEFGSLHLSLAPCCQLAPPRRSEDSENFAPGNGAKDGTKDWEELPTKIADSGTIYLQCEYYIYMCVCDVYVYIYLIYTYISILFICIMCISICIHVYNDFYVCQHIYIYIYTI